MRIGARRDFSPPLTRRRDFGIPYGIPIGLTTRASGISTRRRASGAVPRRPPMSARLNSAQARDIAYYLHPYTNLSAHEKEGPLVITRGEGIYVFDDAGNRYIEGLGGLFCASLG